MPTTLTGLQKPGHQYAYIADGEPAAIAETLVAFANSDGGWLVLGLDAEGNAGAFVTDEEAADAVRKAERMCRPPVRTVDWQPLTVAGGIGALLRVERSAELHALADGRVLVRRGADNEAAAGDEIERLLSSRPIGEFELQAVPGATREDLSEEIIDEYLERRQKRSPRQEILPKDKLLQQIGALTEDRTPTVAGLLLFGKDPHFFMPQCRAVFVKFADTQPRTPEGALGYGRREEFTGPLPLIIDRAWRVLWEEMDKSAVVRGLQRQEETEYPTTAVREALVNAVAHRDYRISGRGIEIRMYTDRMEITSPGGLPAHITLENLVEEHYSRNPRLVNGLYQWGYIEELGLGIDRMIEDMVKAGHPPPKFESPGHRFTVILYNARDRARAAQGWESNMNERQLKALEYMQQNGFITNSDYRQLCPHVGAETLRLDLVDMVNNGVLLKIGDKRGTRYILK
jgi:ATP-dependent DNA helicase RecG